MTEGSPMTEGSGALSSYMRGGTGGRAPVDVLAPPPPRLAQTVPAFRRPVVAVLDTGLATHPWLDVPVRGLPAPADAFVSADPAIQDAVRRQELATSAAGGAEVFPDAWESPIDTGSVTGVLDTHTGHGTFIAGIVRQVAPDAAVRAIRIMHSDGVVYEDDLLLALGMLAARVTTAQQNNDATDLVDVVSLSLGYFSETDDDATYTRQVEALVRQLTDAGVLVVASAGNQSTVRPFYPAALAGPAGGGLPVVSMGAFNPNGSKALFSDDADWVRYWASGAAVVSTYPAVSGSRGPAYDEPAPNAPGLPQRRQTIDGDDFNSGFATWSGTSFASAYGAARLAAALFQDRDQPMLGLESAQRSDMLRRAGVALNALAQ
jgi:subtilisin family serine protease